MKVRNILISTGLVIVVAAGVLWMRILEPVGMFPGGSLSGDVKPKSADWGWVSDIPNIELETSPDAPYSVTIWGVGIGPDFYVATGIDGTSWSARIDANPDVRLRVGDGVYPLRGSRVQDPAERQRVIAAYNAKYDMEQYDNFVNEGLIYRLDGR